jgi:hypothetical protein
MTAARYLTRDEIDARLAARSTVPWYKAAVPMYLLLILVALGIFAVLFSIGLTLHEAGANPPFNSVFESIHNWLGDEHPVAGWMWRPRI